MKKTKNLIVTVLSISLTLGTLTTGAGINTAKAHDYGLNNPRVDDWGVVTWDCVEFGTYKQTPKFEKEQIRWRVLSVEGDKALIISDKILDNKPFDTDNQAETWKDCTLNAWLNTEFVNNAFSSEEMYAIDQTEKLFILSTEDIVNEAYGFATEYDKSSKTREAYNTDFAKYNEAYTPSWGIGTGRWWSLSVNGGKEEGAYVYYSGNGHKDNDINIAPGGVRPALYINLSETSVWTEAPSIDSEGNDYIGDGKIEEPKINDGITTWDCIYFGNYNQTATFENEPITWRVLSVDGNDAFLMSDKNLDCKQYNKEYAMVTWEDCTLRNWLNNEFINSAFTSEEQQSIITTNVINDGDWRPNTTLDKVYLLSLDEVNNATYGFGSGASYNNRIRGVKNTDYAKMNNVYTSEKSDSNGYWWLRTANHSCFASRVNCDGIYVDSLMTFDRDDSYTVTLDNCGIRPVLHLDLTSSLWKHAGTVTSTCVYEDYVPVTTSPTETPIETERPKATESFQTTETLKTTEPKITVAPVKPTNTTKPSSKKKKIEILSMKFAKKGTKISGKLSVSKATVKIKVGNNVWKKAKTNGKKFTFKTDRLKSNGNIQIKITKKGYKTLKKKVTRTNKKM